MKGQVRSRNYRILLGQDARSGSCLILRNRNYKNYSDNDDAYKSRGQSDIWPLQYELF